MKRKQIGLILKKKRRALNMTQGDLAKHFGFSSAQFISNIERGLADIPLRKVKSFAQILELNGEWLAQKVVKAKYERLTE